MNANQTTSSPMLGHDVIIFDESGSNLLAACKTLAIDHDADTIETGSPSSGQFRTFIAGRHGWNVQTSHLVKNTPQTIMVAGNTYLLTIEDRQSSEEVTRLQGLAICIKASVTANVGSLSIGTFQFLGSGPLTPLERIDHPFTIQESVLDGPDILA